MPLLSAGRANGLRYFIMPFVDGESLRARLSKGMLPITDVALALSYAHQHGVVHRDRLTSSAADRRRRLLFDRLQLNAIASARQKNLSMT